MDALTDPFIATQFGRLKRRIAELEQQVTELENEAAKGVHTCHADCPRPMCVLRRENAALKAEREWVPVSERLPETVGVYLVVCDGAVVCFPYLTDGWGDHQDRAFTSFRVTHWMPLPTPPEAGE